MNAFENTWIIGSILVLLACFLLLWVTGALRWLMPSKPKSAPSKISDSNQRQRADEVGRQPDKSGLFRFGVAPDPATPFEDINYRLLIWDSEARGRLWPERRIKNDYPTVISGDLPWLRDKIMSRLRPGHSVLLDTLGWWAQASQTLEINPYAISPVITAYCTWINIEKRPVVISRPWRDEFKTGKLEFLRYGFEDFELDPKYLADYPDLMLFFALSSFVGEDEQWRLFSPARMRKYGIDKAKEISGANAAQQEMMEELRRANAANRFAALWDLRNPVASEVGK